MAPQYDQHDAVFADADSSHGRERVRALVEVAPRRTLKVPAPLKGLPIVDLLARLDLSQTIQLTSFQPTGMVILDICAKLGLLRDMRVVFIDTLYHFPQTYEHIAAIRNYYPDLDLTIYRPAGADTREQFEALYGRDLWQEDPERFGYLTKAEPRDRALDEMRASVYINGRRADQGGERARMDLVEFDATVGAIQVQPLYDWTSQQVWQYIHRFGVPYNKLHDLGYKSIGDIFTTVPVAADAPERSGRWVGSNKTECGLHTLAGPRRGMSGLAGAFSALPAAIGAN
eukprot:Unigene3815_Nuclearia_a/m.11636 Unigene3815_Nuclearia_a/g.11636  ORF Unigene3815_Nuclearia_a/g.11636 Unigene3815_Nuclearia_a/m.11636 type:complete len:286 (+) Unigene3815_Nuclearia_a:182-1039(+)